MPGTIHPSRSLIPLVVGAGLLLAACQQQSSGPAPATPKPAATSQPAAKASPAAAASPAPAASPAAGPVAPTVPSPAVAASPAASPSPAAGENAVALILNASGQAVGTALFSDESNGVRVLVQVTDLPPGPHGIHVHAVGRCDPPDFMTAGGHFNPSNRQHGLQNPAGPHAGDLPNLEVGPDGNGQLNARDDRFTLRPGPNSLFDADGSALVIHASPDDNVSDPAGNSGARIACGLIERA